MTQSATPAVMRLRGIRHNNLKNLDLDLPLGRLIVITGLSGSGKSSLAFDTLFAEGQRRYIETFSPYARQFFDRMDKPQVDRIENIPPAIAIEQRNTVKTTRSTVGTMTELADYLKVLWPQIARLHCRRCAQPVRKEPPRVVWNLLGAIPELRDADVLITFDLPLSEKLSLEETLSLIARQGYQRLLVNGQVLRLEEFGAQAQAENRYRKTLTVVQDRLRLADEARARLIEACEQAYHFGKGKLTIFEMEPAVGACRPRLFSAHFHCAACDLEYREPTPALFSFNHPAGACPACKGFGRTITIDYNLAVPDRTLTLAEGAVKPWRSGFSAECQGDLLKFCRVRRVPTDVPFASLPPYQQAWVLEGDPDYGTDDAHQWPHAWYGVKGYFRWLEGKSYKMHVRVLLSRYRAYATCPQCQGQRLQPDALLYFVDVPPPRPGDCHPIADRRLTLADFNALPLGTALELIRRLASKHAFPAGDPTSIVLSEVESRLKYLVDVGLGYLTLDRPTRTLSGGETERVSLTTCLGARLVNTLFVLDEPSVGLHPRDTERLVRLLQGLRDAGNTVVVVEHEAGVIRAADHIVDLGPGSGEAGGDVIFQGGLRELMADRRSLTAAYLAGRREIAVPRRRSVVGVPGALPATHEKQRPEAPATTPLRWLTLGNATRHNLKGLAVHIPLQRFVCLTGVSGSGKTTLVREVLMPALEARLRDAARQVKASDRFDSPEPSGDTQPPESTAPCLAQVEGFSAIGRVVLVDQSPLGKTPRSNPAVYVGAFDHIRELFAQTDAARQLGLNASAFSFNSGQGQCERCRGAGFEKVEMQFLSDVFIRCPECQGRRYRSHILEVRVQAHAPEDGQPDRVVDGGTSGGGPSWSIADVLEATVDQVLEFLERFADNRHAVRARLGLKLLHEVGLGYLRLGQPVNTLSGGECQRLKLVSYLAESLAQPGGTPAATEAAALHSGPSTLFLFDEPTTGLHFDDVRVLVQVFQRLVDAGHSLVVIEHNLDVIKCADWIIDLGPEAGEGGGNIVAAGTPETVADCAHSHTGRFLRPLLSAGRRRARSSVAPGKEARTESLGTSSIRIVGAREHNLKNLTLDIPRGRFVVVTGVSGSGKSTLAFDLLFAEGQRRFLDSMNAYARQFVEQLARPNVDVIAGLPPTVSIEQRTTRGGGKSTVATVTEVYHFLRLLFARLGTQFCPDCELPVEGQTREQLGARLKAELRKRGDLLLLAPVVKNRKGFHSDVAVWAAEHGYREIRADGRMHDTSKPFRLDRFREHDVEIVMGVLERKGRRLGLSPQSRVDEAIKIGRGTLYALDNHGALTVHSTERACPGCGRSYAPLDPKNFSYNSAQGWCPRCRGFGETFWMPEDVDRGERADAIEETWFNWMEGKRDVCPECQGARLNPVARAVRLSSPEIRLPQAGVGKAPTIDALSRLAVGEARNFLRGLRFKGRAALIARDILPEMLERLKFLHEVGLGYLELGRAVTTLSGGEAQRIRLAAQLGSNLSGVLYVLDEPTIGLHASDNEKLLATLHALQGRGNSLVVVEHDEETMRHADYIVDLGPGAGVHGGQLVAGGTLNDLLRHADSVTGQCLRAKTTHPARGLRRPVGRAVRQVGRGGRQENEWLTLEHATAHNLRDLTVQIPLKRLVVITGVSGSGKSTLVRECLLPALALALKPRRGGRVPKAPGSARAAALRGAGHESLKAVYEVDQSPIGRTPRSVPATYVGFFDEIRRLFAQTPEARMRGYGPGRFSFNSSQGRCPGCEGAGIIKLEMNFLPPAFVTCETCGGSRFNRETLDIEYRHRNIAQVLEMSVEEALGFFAGIPKVCRPLEALHDTGLDYLKLGQTSPTLSGGEAQRVKLVTHLLSGLREAPDRSRLGALAAKRNLFILEEPTIGLHMADVRRLVEVLQRLVDAGHSVLVIEHNLDLIAEADWLIDLGPEAGAAGGGIVATGPPERVARNKRSHTGRFLRKVLRTA